jgi:hypothetical protein
MCNAVAAEGGGCSVGLALHLGRLFKEQPFRGRAVSHGRMRVSWQPKSPTKKTKAIKDKIKEMNQPAS